MGPLSDFGAALGDGPAIVFHCVGDYDGNFAALDGRCQPPPAPPQAVPAPAIRAASPQSARAALLVKQQQLATRAGMTN